MSDTDYRKALLAGKCPACRQGDIFQYPFRRLSRFMAMNKECPVCRASFEPEPGFYFGAMYITYAFNVVILVIFSVLLYWLIDLPVWVNFLLIFSTSVLLAPLMFRVSRVLWLYWFGGLHYNSQNQTRK